VRNFGAVVVVYSGGPLGARASRAGMRLSNLGKEYGKLGNPKCRAGARFDGCNASEAGARFLIDPDDCAEPRRSKEFQVFSVTAGVSPCGTYDSGVHVDVINTLGVSAGCFASFRVVKSSVFPVQSHFCDGFDSRQLH
jgi:hypothetical protein